MPMISELRSAALILTTAINLISPARVMAQGVERLLLPIATEETPGAYGAVSETWAYNDSNETVAIGPVSPVHFALAPKSVARLRPAPVPAGAAGLLLNIPSAFAENVHITTRVRDITRLTSGAGIPAVREEAFSSEPLTFLNVPLSSSSRILLRVYQIGRIRCRYRHRTVVSTKRRPSAERTALGYDKSNAGASRTTAFQSRLCDRFHRVRN